MLYVRLGHKNLKKLHHMYRYFAALAVQLYWSNFMYYIIYNIVQLCKLLHTVPPTNRPVGQHLLLSVIWLVDNNEDINNNNIKRQYASGLLKKSCSIKTVRKGEGGQFMLC